MANAHHEGEEPIAGAGYRLVRFLGRGGFGEVWKANAPGGAEVAVKFVQLGGAEGRKEFRALELVKRIRHPNLMPLNAFWLKSDDGGILNESFATQQALPQQETGQPSPRETMVIRTAAAGPRATELIIVMGLGDKSLMDRLEECRAAGGPGIPREELLHYLDDAARAIDFLNRLVHEQESGPVAIQHCDIKPHNLMIVGGAVQVCDFGLARMMGADKTTTVAGSLAYAAPECLETGIPSASTDQYSLAITYYELATGLLPFADQTVAAVVSAKRLGTLNFSAVSPGEQAVLRQATSPDPKQRYSSSVAMVAALRQPISGGLETTRALPPRGRRRVRSAPVAIVAVALLVVAASTGWWQWERRYTAAGPPVASTGKTAPSVGAPAPDRGNAGKTVAIASVKTTVPERTKPAPVATASAGKAEAAATPIRVYLERGTGYIDQGNYDLAIADLNQAALLDSRDARIYSRRGVAWFHKNDLRKAVDDFTTAIRIAPDAKDYINRGQAHRKLGELDAAIADFLQAAQQDPHGAAAFYHLGDCYMSKEQYDKAIAAFSDALKAAAELSEPGFALADAYYLRGLCHLAVEHADAAISDFTAALRLGSKDEASIHDSRASAYELKNAAAPAMVDRQLASWYTQLEAKPGDAETCRQIAYTLATTSVAELRDGKRALELARRACEATSWKNAACLSALAAASAEAGQFAEAISWATKAIDLAPDPATAKRYQGHFQLYRSGKPLRAESSSAS